MSDALRTTRQVILETLGGLAAFRRVDDDLYVVKQGSALVLIGVAPWGDRALVRCVAQLVKGARLDGNLALQLLRLNAVLRFGAFAHVPDGDLITFQHAILGGPGLDPDELRATVRDVALVADEYDDRIAERYGGHTMRDLVEDPALADVLRQSPDAFPLGG